MTWHARRAGTVTVAIAVAPLAAGAACSGGTGPAAQSRARSYRMGFSNFPPRLNDSVAVATVLMWVQRADAAILHLSVPWTALLAGAPVDSLVAAQQGGLVSFYRSRGLTVVVEVDVTDGLDRSREDPALDSAGRSITELPVQQLYHGFVGSIVRLLAPDYLGLASEVNLIQAAAPSATYTAVVQMANAAAADVRAAGGRMPLYVSVQVETAWGRLGPPGSPFVGLVQVHAQPASAVHRPPGADPGQRARDRSVSARLRRHRPRRVPSPAAGIHRAALRVDRPGGHGPRSQAGARRLGPHVRAPATPVAVPRLLPSGLASGFGTGRRSVTPPTRFPCDARRHPVTARAARTPSAGHRTRALSHPGGPHRAPPRRGANPGARRPNRGDSAAASERLSRSSLRAR